MGVCFLCDTKLFGERTRVCSSITPHSNVPYPEKIVELLGEDFVVIVTPTDHMCKRCTSLLMHMDKLENDLKLVKNAMVSYIQKKYGVMPADQPVKSVEVVNGHIKTDELEIGQRKVPSGLTTVRENNNAHASIKMVKTMPPPVTIAAATAVDSSKVKIYKCGFCSYQSKDLNHVRFHMRTHTMAKKVEIEKTQIAPKPVSPPMKHPSLHYPRSQYHNRTLRHLMPVTTKKRLYRCQVCSKSFDSRVGCLEHIQKEHNHASSTSNEEKESEVSSSDSKVTKKDNQAKFNGKLQVESSKNSDGTTKNKNKVVDTDKLLKDKSVSAEVRNVEPEQTENNDEDGEQADEAGKEATEEEAEKAEEPEDAEELQETAAKRQKKSAPVDDNSDQEDAMQVDEETSDSAEKSAGKNKARDLDIESMLAAIHNDNPSTDSADTQNSV